jgi:hypothetical protein
MHAKFILAKCERKSSAVRIEKFNLKCPVLYLSLLPYELVETGFGNLAGTVGS